MSKRGGFDAMDLSVHIMDDPKFKRLAREDPDLMAGAFMIYIATAAASWREGERVPAEDAWPGSLLAYDDRFIAALRRVGLLDIRNRVAARTWKNWYELASSRRTASRERWRRYKESRSETARLPRGTNAATTPILSVPLEREPSMNKSSSTGAGARGMESLRQVMKGIVDPDAGRS